MCLSVLVNLTTVTGFNTHLHLAVSIWRLLSRTPFYTSLPPHVAAVLMALVTSRMLSWDVLFYFWHVTSIWAMSYFYDMTTWKIPLHHILFRQWSDAKIAWFHGGEFSVSACMCAGIWIACHVSPLSATTKMLMPVSISLLLDIRVDIELDHRYSFASVCNLM